MALGQGVEVDWVSGVPIEPSPSPQAHEKTQKLLSQHERMQTVSNALASESGGVLMREITDCLAGRIRALVEADPECVGYLKVLRQLGYDLDIGHRAASALVVASVGQAP